MPARGRVTIATRAVELDDAYAQEHDGVVIPRGSYVQLSLSDTGVGMDSNVQARIFEPFFSTKENGRGLGLAAVRGIVRSHGGTLEVRSEAGLGASFRVWFPRDAAPTGADA
jgi:signal transduction histidine kinase